MPTSLGIIKGKILGILNKQPIYQGFYTNEKINDAVNDSIDWVYANMMFIGNGWTTDIFYVTTTANTESYTLNTDLVTIDNIRYKVGDTWIPIPYDDLSDKSYAGTLNTSETPVSWRLLGNKIYFNSVPTSVGTNFLQIEGSFFLPDLSSDGNVFNARISKGLENYVKWRACSQLVSQVGKPIPEWSRYEDEWYGHMKELCAQRVRRPRFMKDFNEG